MRYKATATLRALYAVPNICDIDKVGASSINVTKTSMHVNKLFANNHLRCFSGEATSYIKNPLDGIKPSFRITMKTLY